MMKQKRLLWQLCLLFSIIVDGQSTELCPELDEESILQKGHEYSYRLQAQAISEFSGTGDDKSEIIMGCDIVITHSHDCFYELQMLNCSFASRYLHEESDTVHEHQNLASISRYPVMFSMRNGVITDVYANPSDPLFSVNIKKGVLSMFIFKLSMMDKEVKEVQADDIHGSCYLTSVPGNEAMGTVQTYRDLSQCTAKGCKDSLLHGWSIISSQNFIKHFLNSSVECQYKINQLEKEMEKVLCKEKHCIEMNFLQETSQSPITSIYYKMEHVQSTKLTGDANYELPMRKTSIFFECSETEETEFMHTHSLATAERMLIDLVETSQNEIKLSNIGVFKTFVKSLRTSANMMPFVESVLKCSDSFSEICSSALKKELAISYLIDALVECNTISCIEAISYLSTKNFLPDMYLDYILYSWSNMDHSYKKSDIADHVMNICQQKNSRFCWLILGTLVKNSMMEQGESSDLEIPTSLRKIASYYDDQVISTCKACSSSSVYFSSLEKQYNHLYTFVKAIGNMGVFYSVLVPDGVISLLTCFTSKSLPVYQKATILDTLKKLDVCNNSEVCKVIHSKLFPVLNELNGEVELQMHIFELSMLYPEKFTLLPTIIKILTEYENSQMKAFIASYLNTKMQDQGYTEENKKFIHELLYELRKHKIELSSFYQGKERKSSISTQETTFGFPFLPQKIREFGMKLDTLTIYRIYSMIPHFLRSNIVLKFFGKMIHIAQFGIHFEGFSDIGRIFMKVFHDISKMKSFDSLFGTLTSALFEILSSLSSKEPSYELNYHLDETVINNIKNIHNIYKAYNSEASPFFSAYLDIFGNTLNFFSLGDIVNFISGMKGTEEVFGYLHNGIVFNTSRILRLISAQHQVSTIIGLPLILSSDLTLAFAVRSKAKIGFNEEVKKLHWNTDLLLQPSAAVTLLNKVVLGSPKIMQIGVQLNSSCYTSTHWKARHVYTGSGNNWKLDIEKPEIPQTLLQFSLQSGTIKYRSSESIACCDYKKTSEWCFSDTMSSVLGLKICQEVFNQNKARESSQLKNVFSCYKWGLYVHPHDSKLKTYSFEMSKKSESSRDETEMRFHTIYMGSAYNHEVIISFSEDKQTTESLLNLRITAFPDFLASASSKGLLVKDGAFGYKMQAVFQLSKDFKYQFIYKNTVSMKDITEGSYNEFGNEITGKIHESTMQLDTPFNLYKLIKKTSIKDGSMQQSIVASYSNFVSQWNWLSRILPLDFWETNSKAWIQVDFKTKLQMGEVTSHSTLGYIKSPHMFNEFSQTSLTGPGREQIHFSLRRIKSESLELITFLNATYNFLNSGNDISQKEIKVFNVTIPLRSWSAEIEKNVIIDEGKALYHIIFTQSTVASKDKAGHTNNVEQWHNKASDRFEVEEKKYRFKMGLTDKVFHDMEPMTDGFSSENKTVFLSMSKHTNFDIKLFYPHGETEEQVTCHGKYLISSNYDLSRFQLDFTLFLSRMNLKLHSSSLYEIHKGFHEIFHKDTFTYGTTGTQAIYNLFAQYNKAGDCNNIVFSHNISSYVVDFSSNVTYHCKPNDPKLHVMLLNIDSTSAIWNTLNSELRQIIEDVNHEYSEESMNYSTPLIVINVTADWRGAKDHYDHTKKAIFRSLWNKVPSFEINFKSMMDGLRSFQINFHDEKAMRILCKMQFLNIIGDFQADINYADIESNQEWISFISMNSILQNTGERIWAGEINRASLQKIVHFWKNAYIGAEDIMSSILSEPSHPLNQILKPILNTTLSEYWTALKSQGKTSLNLVLLEVGIVAKSLEPLYFPFISVICNSLQEAKTIVSYLNFITKDPSETKWNYLGLLNCAISRIYHYISKQLFFVDYTNQHKVTFKFRSFPLLQMFNPNMVFSSVFPMTSNLVPVHKEEPQQLYRKAPGSKVALIYGQTQIYSFDGHVYEFTDNKSECVFLLSHDAHRSAFSIVASADTLHFLFTTITISINGKNEVYINGSSEQSSLPIEAENENVMVRREGEIIFVQSPSLSIMCDSRNLICALESSGWNTDILGIMGNADGEANNEYMLPNGKIASNASVFTAAYELSGHPECRTTDLLVKLKEVPDVKGMCQRRRERKEEETLVDNYCSIAKGFQATSQDTCEGDSNKDINILFPPKAVDAICYLEGFDMKISSNFQGGKQKLNQVKHLFEVVLLVHEHSLMSQDDNSYIKNILKALEKKFHSEKYFDIQYSLVGFGGKGFHYKPSIHTIDGNVWVPYKVLVNDLLKALEFKGTDKLNPVIPIKYVAESLGYDTFGSKIFILFTIKDEKQTSQEILETSVKHLLKNGITLHVFETYPGIEKEGVCGIKSDGSLLSSSKTVDVKQAIIHNGDLVKIAFATGGVVFSKGSQDSNSSFECYLEFAQEVWNKVKKEEALCRNCNEVKGMWWNNYQECMLQEC